MTACYSGILIWRGTYNTWMDFNIWPPTPMRACLAGYCVLCDTTISSATIHQHARHCDNYDGEDALLLDIFITYEPDQWRRFYARSAAFLAFLRGLRIRCITCDRQRTSVAALEHHFAAHVLPAAPPPTPARPRVRCQPQTRLLAPPHALQRDALPPYAENLSYGHRPYFYLPLHSLILILLETTTMSRIFYFSFHNIFIGLLLSCYSILLAHTPSLRQMIWHFGRLWRRAFLRCLLLRRACA